MKLEEARALAAKITAAADAAEAAGQTEVELADVGLARVDEAVAERRKAIAVAEAKAAQAESKPAE